jgi:uncharacterized protein (DUF1697 family)
MENRSRRTSLSSYVAFLRGINVGGNKKIRMASLAQAFEALGFQNVRTLLASGNVLFQARSADPRALTRRIEQRIEQTFRLEVSIILRTRREIQQLLDANPFKSIRVTPRTRLFVTFLAGKPKATLKIPYESPDKSFRILGVAGRDVCSVLTLGPQWAKNLRQMDILEKEFGQRITTRNWNTVQKCGRSAADWKRPKGAALDDNASSASSQLNALWQATEPNRTRRRHA